MKKFITWLCLGIFLFAGIYAAVDMSEMPRTYDGREAAVPVYDLLRDPKAYDDTEADGAAAAIVQQNLAESRAVNDVTSVVFDFRGYDTMGEAFLLITAVAGSTVILFTKDKKGKEEKKDEE